MTQNETMQNTQTETTMIPVASCDGHPRFIPSDRASTRIDASWLKEKSACSEGLAWFKATVPEGCTYLELRTELAAQSKVEWEMWILSAIGGDTATAGYSGTAIAGYSGTATAGDRGTATAGEDGIIRIFEWCEKQSRSRVITGIIGENGIKANVPYVCENGKLTPKKP
jgi:hypothetical protein